MKKALLAVLLLAAPQTDSVPGPRELTVRLYWLRRPAQMTLAPTGGGAQFRRCSACRFAPLEGPLEIQAISNRLALAGEPKVRTTLEVEGAYRLSTPDNEPLELEAPLRVEAAGGRLLLTVRLPLETYVAGVLAGESGGFRAQEALQAMAVTARTYAVRFRGRHNSEGFDLCDTTHCQDLRLSALTQRMHNTAEATEGELLWFDGLPAATFYHRNCGGTTEAVGRVWPGLQAPYLRQQTDNFCVARDRGEWRAAIPREKLEAALAAAGVRLQGSIESLQVLSRTPSGRVERLRLTGTAKPELEAERLRRAIGQALGWNLIRSDLYEVRRVRERFVFTGYGSGHGVGLCQVGAQQMAEDGHSYREILAFYYPGTVLGLTARGLAWRALAGEHVEVLTTEPNEDRPLLPLAERLLRRAEAETGWELAAQPQLRVYPSVEVFRNATGEPGWVAASTRGRVIRLQPRRVLENRRRLEETLYHELLHMLMDARMAPGLPLWFREGLVLYLSDRSGRIEPLRRRLDLSSLEHMLLVPRNQAELRRAYRSAQGYVTALVEQYGREKVLGWVRTGLPHEQLNAVR